jgi:hypothetical protein
MRGTGCGVYANSAFASGLPVFRVLHLASLRSAAWLAALLPALRALCSFSFTYTRHLIVLLSVFRQNVEKAEHYRARCLAECDQNERRGQAL